MNVRVISYLGFTIGSALGFILIPSRWMTNLGYVSILHEFASQGRLLELIGRFSLLCCLILVTLFLLFGWPRKTEG